MLYYSVILVSAAFIATMLGFVVLAAKAVWIVGRFAVAFFVR